MGKGRARIFREGRGAGATARAGVCPVDEAVRCTRLVERVSALATAAHSLFRWSGSRRKRRAKDTYQVLSDEAAKKQGRHAHSSDSPPHQICPSSWNRTGIRSRRFTSLAVRQGFNVAPFVQTADRKARQGPIDSCAGVATSPNTIPSPVQPRVHPGTANISLLHFFFSAIKTHTWCPMRNTEHIYS